MRHRWSRCLSGSARCGSGRRARRTSTPSRWCSPRTGRSLDAYPIVTGFRKTAFNGGTSTGGVYINDKYVYLTGYAIRATNEWAAIGGAVPEWMTELDGQMIRDSNANLIRWMHIAAPPANIRMTDKYGIVCIQPAGDKESDVTGRQWDQRVELMRDVLIYYRNNPSILFWEAGNNWMTAAHMTQMVDLRKTWDPNGGRAMGCRAISDSSAYGGTAAVDVAEYVGTMLNRHYSVYTRDRKPIIECEYTRDEAPRRVWDNYSPPDFGYVVGPDVTYKWNSEEFAGTLAASLRYEFWGQRIQGPGDRRYSGSAALVWADSNQHGRQYNWECARLSGRVDAVRIPKESLHTYRVMQNPAADLHIIGHWTYPSGTKKTVYVMASAAVKRVQLLVNGTQVGTSGSPTYDFLHTFANVSWQSGTITAVGFDAAGAEVVRAVQEPPPGAADGAAPDPVRRTGWVARRRQRHRLLRRGGGRRPGPADAHPPGPGGLHLDGAGHVPRRIQPAHPGQRPQVVREHRGRHQPGLRPRRPGRRHPYPARHGERPDRRQRKREFRRLHHLRRADHPDAGAVLTPTAVSGASGQWRAGRLPGRSAPLSSRGRRGAGRRG